ncbi:Pdp3-interacting factor 1 [Grifola frondosa]|uniref:Pdp3-interacting factor 1 n=1 Tax=Grifola frondosa TaxID=5627 RepID=A0A1C7LLH2_GRIFR|nr:Pdp3-interacting factor 1 [Grifola frondosa]
MSGYRYAATERIYSFLISARCRRDTVTASDLADLTFAFTSTATISYISPDYDYSDTWIMEADAAPASTLPYPPIHRDKKFVVLSDWLVGPQHVLSSAVGHGSWRLLDVIVCSAPSNNSNSLIQTFWARFVHSMHLGVVRIGTQETNPANMFSSALILDFDEPYMRENWAFDVLSAAIFGLDQSSNKSIFQWEGRHSYRASFVPDKMARTTPQTVHFRLRGCWIYLIYMTDNLGYGAEKRRQGNLDILSGKVTFRDEFRRMLASVVANGHTFDHCKEVLKQNISLDTGFKDFYEYCKAHDIPVVIISSGMAPLIRAVLSNLIGEADAKDIEIVSNDVDIFPDGKWEIKYRTRAGGGYGHDKSQAILPYRDLSDPPVVFFFGDGVSDMSAARHADVLFVKQKEGADNDLAAFCRREGIPHILFEDFGHALGAVRSVVEGAKSVTEVLAIGRATKAAAH